MERSFGMRWKFTRQTYGKPKLSLKKQALQNLTFVEMVMIRGERKNDQDDELTWVLWVPKWKITIHIHVLISSHFLKLLHPALVTANATFWKPVDGFGLYMYAVKTP